MDPCPCKQHNNSSLQMTMRDIKGKAVIAGVAAGMAAAFSLLGVSGIIEGSLGRAGTPVVAAAVTGLSVFAGEFVMDYVKL